MIPLHSSHVGGADVIQISHHPTGGIMLVLLHMMQFGCRGTRWLAVVTVRKPSIAYLEQELADTIFWSIATFTHRLRTHAMLCSDSDTRFAPERNALQSSLCKMVSVAGSKRTKGHTLTNTLLTRQFASHDDAKRESLLVTSSSRIHENQKIQFF